MGHSDPHCTVKRNGLTWNLDLREGIDLAIYLFGAFEPKTVHCYQKILKDGDWALDIGANIGAHTLPLAQAVSPKGQVCAIEPTDWAHSKLTKNLSLNPEIVQKVKTFQVALSDGKQKKTSGFYSSWNVHAKTEAHPDHGGILNSAAGAKWICLDDLRDQLDPKKIRLIKVDIDGHEPEAFRGGVKFLKETSAILLMEFSPHQLEEFGSSYIEMLDLLRAAGFKKLYTEDKKEIPWDHEKIFKSIPSKGSRNFLVSKDEF